MDRHAHGADVVDALHHLEQTIRPAPVSARGPVPSDGGTWVTVDTLGRSHEMRRLARAYSDDLGTPHRAVGAACGLQHYSGRMALTMLGTWVQTGAVLTPRPSSWAALLTPHGHTLRVAVDPDVHLARAGLTGVLRAVHEHCAPVVEAARIAGGLSERLAWGSVAASVAGALGRLVRTLPDDAAQRLRVAVRSEGGMTGWHRLPLVTFVEHDAGQGPRLWHERHTCCLIRLGRDEPCGTCPQAGAEHRSAARHRACSIPRPDVLLAAGAGL